MTQLTDLKAAMKTGEGLQKQLEKIQQVKTIKSLGNSRWQFISEPNKDIRKEIFDFAVANELTLLEMKKESSSVEDVFQELTK